VADELDRKALERAEERALQRRGLHLSPDGTGGATLRGSLDSESAAIVRAALDPLTAPQSSDAGLDRRSAPQRRADALTEICRNVLGTDLLSTSGGEPIQLVVTCGFDPLTRQLGAGMLGEFNRSSQHLEFGGVDGPASRVDEGVDGQIGDEVAGQAVASARCRASVLAWDRPRPQ